MHEQYARDDGHAPTKARLTKLPARVFQPTDYGNAERLVAQHGRDLHYCAAWGQWLCWDGQRWRPDDDGAVMRRAKDTVRSMYAEAAQIGNDDQRDKFIAHVRRSEANSSLKAMIALAQSERGIPVRPDELDHDPMLLSVQNGTLDLCTGELRPHRRDDLITKLAPVRYDPEAECPTWDAFLDRIMAGNADLVAFLHRAIGYSLTGDVTERALFVLHGAGRNGKSTLLEVIRALLGDYAMHTPTETLLAKDKGAIPNDVARLKGARFVFASETEDGRRLAEARIKALTGGDTVSARFMRAEFFDFRPQFKIWLATNHRPLVRGTDPAIWDRLKLIPFTVRIPDEAVDRELPAKLRAELPGILNRVVQACLDWQRDGLDVPREVKAATAEYRVEMDVLAHFLDERTIPEPGAQVAYAELCTAYQAWAKAAGEYTISGRLFNQRLTERGLEGAKSTGGRYYWKGLRLTPTSVPSVPIGAPNPN